MGKHHEPEVMSNRAAPGVLWTVGEGEPASNPPLPHSPGRLPPANTEMEPFSCRGRKIFTFVAAAAFALSGVQAQEALVHLKGNISPLVARAMQMDHLDAGTRIRFAIALPVRNEEQLDALIKHLYTPGDPLYHQYLRKGEFADRFGPTPDDYNAVIAFAQMHGLEVVGTHPNRVLLDVAGPAEKVEQAFGVRLMHYRAGDGRVFHAPDVEPFLPASVSRLVSGIIGLDDAVQLHPNFVPAAKMPGSTPAQIGSGPNQGLSPSDKP